MTKKLNLKAVSVTTLFEKVGKILADKNVEISMFGDMAYCEYDENNIPKKVVVPALSDSASQETIAAVFGYLDHEIAHVIFTNMEDIREWTSAYDGVRRRLAHKIENAFEDAMIERNYKKKYVGAHRTLSATEKMVAEKSTQNWRKSLADIYSDMPDGEIKERFMAIAVLPSAVRAARGNVHFEKHMEEIWPFIPKSKAFFDKYRFEIRELENSKEACAMSQKFMDEVVCLSDDDDVFLPPEEGGEGSESEDKKEEGSNSKEGDPQEGGDENGDGKDGNEHVRKDDGDQEAGDSGEEAEGDKRDGSDSKREESDEGDSEDDTDGGESGESSSASDEEDDSDGSPSRDSRDGEAEDDGGQDSSNESGGPSGEEGDDSDGADVGSPSPGDSHNGDEDSADGKRGPERGGSDNGSDPEIDESDDGGRGDDEDNSGEMTDEQFDAAMDMMGDFAEAMQHIISTMAAKENEKYRLFTRDFDLYSPPPENPHLVNDLEIATKEHVGPIASRLSRVLKARSFSRREGGHRRGRLSSSALHRMAVKDDRIFYRKEVHTTKEVAVSVLVDCSGSMSGRKMTLATEAAYASMMALQRAGVKCEVTGFTDYVPGPSGNTDDYNHRQIDRWLKEYTSGKYSSDLLNDNKYSRTLPLRHYHFKQFDEAITPQVKARLATFHSRSTQGDFLAHNIDGESVMFAAKRLAERKEPRKLLLVYSDGSPYGNNNSKDKEVHLKSSVEEIVASGIDCFGIGIMDNNVKKYYPENDVVNSMDELASRSMDILSKYILKGTK